MNRHCRQVNKGFTLVEVMVVVVIIAILAAIIVPKILSRPEEARKVKARSDIMAIQNAMEMYKLDNGFYPSTAQGINALVTKPSGDPVPQDWEGYLKAEPKDPWGRAYRYTNPGKHGEIDIWTLGANANLPEDTIGNWTVNQGN